MSLFSTHEGPDKRIIFKSNGAFGVEVVKDKVGTVQYYNRDALYKTHRDATLEEIETLGLAMCRDWGATAFKPDSTGAFYFSLVGGDPEFFVVNKNNHMVPSFEALKLSKDDHIQAYHVDGRDYTGGAGALYKKRATMCDREGRYYQDGYQLEMGYGPVSCLSWNSDTIQATYKAIHQRLSSDNLRLSSYTVKQLGPKILSKHGNIPLGCRPALNAYGENTDISNNNPLLRFTGGHFHLGYRSMGAYFTSTDLNTTDEKIKTELDVFKTALNPVNMGAEWMNKYINPIVKRLDATAGLISLALGGEYESVKRRAYKYGRAGDYRMNINTLEYRTPASPVWFHPAAYHLMAMILRGSVAFSRYIKDSSIFEEARDVINRTDYVGARELIQKSSEIQKVISEYGRYPHKVNKFIQCGIAGKFSDDIVKNWRLGSDTLWITHSESPNCSIAKLEI